MDIKTSNVHTIGHLGVGDCELQVVVEEKVMQLDSNGISSNGGAVSMGVFDSQDERRGFEL